MLKRLNSDPNATNYHSNDTNSDYSGVNSDNSCRSRGFTLLELLLSVAVISLLAGLSLPVYRTLMKKNDLDIAANTIASSLRRAQILSQAVDGDTAVGVDVVWGVRTQPGGIILFKGASYTGRDTDFDETFEVPVTIDVDDTEVIFTKFTGYPQATGTINLSTENDTRAVTINEKGTITY
jgi:prepilin-type N-terminal cleavage/methylation domain-containing protein